MTLNLLDFVTSADKNAEGDVLADAPMQKMLQRGKEMALDRLETRDAFGNITDTTYFGLDRFEIPKAKYAWEVGDHSLAGLCGAEFVGEGMFASQLHNRTKGAIFKSGRGGRVEFSGLSVYGNLDFGSSLISVHQSTGDGEDGRAAFSYRFEDMEIRRQHYGVFYSGNEMTDRNLFTNVRFVDCLNDVRAVCSQHVNSKMLGCESWWAAHGNEQELQSRLDAWKVGAHYMDGAMFKVKRGGGWSIDNCSIIRKSTTLLFEEPLSDEYDDYNTNLLGWIFEGQTGWEMREQDTLKDAFGQERVTLVRSLSPYPDASTKVQPWVKVRDSRIGISTDVSSIDLAHVYNGMALTFEDTRVLGANKARVIGQVNEHTALHQGAYANQRSSRPTYVRKVKEGASTTANHKMEINGVIPTGVTI